MESSVRLLEHQRRQQSGESDRAGKEKEEVGEEVGAKLASTPARAARRSDCGGWPKARMKARRIRSGSRKPVVSATRSIASLDDCTCCRATSMRSRSIAFDGV